MSYHPMLCLNPTLQRTLVFSTVTPGQVNRTSGNYEHASGKGLNVTRILRELGHDVSQLLLPEWKMLTVHPGLDQGKRQKHPTL